MARVRWFCFAVVLTLELGCTPTESAKEREAGSTQAQAPEPAALLAPADASPGLSPPT
jgi:hypothetical protein